MSYDSLSGGAAWTDPTQLPAFLWMEEGNIPRLYNDGAHYSAANPTMNFGNATIGIGLNLKNNPAERAAAWAVCGALRRNLLAVRFAKQTMRPLSLGST